MRLKRAVAIVLTAGVAVACAGCHPKTVSTPGNGLPSIAGVKQNAAHDAAAWAAENPSEASQWLADHSRFLNADYGFPI